MNEIRRILENYDSEKKLISYYYERKENQLMIRFINEDYISLYLIEYNRFFKELILHEISDSEDFNIDENIFSDILKFDMNYFDFDSSLKMIYEYIENQFDIMNEKIKEDNKLIFDDKMIFKLKEFDKNNIFLDNNIFFKISLSEDRKEINIILDEKNNRISSSLYYRIEFHNDFKYYIYHDIYDKKDELYNRYLISFDSELFFENDNYLYYEIYLFLYHQRKYILENFNL